MASERPCTVLPILLFLTVPLAGCEAPARAPITFADLDQGDAIQITVRSKGCFHDSKTTIRVSLDKSGNLRMRGSWRGSHAFWRREQFGGAVSDEGLAALDSLFNYYRSPPGEVFCTTEEEITAIRTRAGRVLQKERFTDATCPRRPFSEVRGIEEILGDILYGGDREPRDNRDLADSA